MLPASDVGPVYADLPVKPAAAPITELKLELELQGRKRGAQCHRKNETNIRQLAVEERIEIGQMLQLWSVTNFLLSPQRGLSPEL